MRISESTRFSTFWQENERNLPLLAKLVRAVCCVGPTTDPSEADFSIDKDIITQKRNKLSDEIVERLSFLKRNMNKNFEEVIIEN